MSNLEETIDKLVESIDEEQQKRENIVEKSEAIKEKLVATYKVVGNKLKENDIKLTIKAHTNQSLKIVIDNKDDYTIEYKFKGDTIEYNSLHFIVVEESGNNAIVVDGLGRDRAIKTYAEHVEEMLEK